MEDELYLIDYFVRKNLSYAGTFRIIFRDRKQAENYIADCDKDLYKFVIYKVKVF